MSQFVQWSNFSKIAPYAELFRQGIVVTVLLSVFTVAIGFCIALILALMRMSNVRPFRALGLDKDGHMREGGPLVWISRFNPLSFLATAYVEILRSTPVIVQVFIIYYGVFGIVQLPSFQIFGFIKFSRFFPGVVALGMNSGAYLCEIIRAGIQSIDGGQTEAARSLGLSQTQNLRYIIFPQALKNILPAIANEFVVIIKEFCNHVHHWCTGYHVCCKCSQGCNLYYRGASAGGNGNLFLPLLPDFQDHCIF